MLVDDPKYVGPFNNGVCPPDERTRTDILSYSDAMKDLTQPFNKVALEYSDMFVKYATGGSKLRWAAISNRVTEMKADCLKNGVHPVVIHIYGQSFLGKSTAIIRMFKGLKRYEVAFGNGVFGKRVIH
jgi:hypothetical protein